MVSARCRLRRPRARRCSVVALGVRRLRRPRARMGSVVADQSRRRRSIEPAESSVPPRSTTGSRLRPVSGSVEPVAGEAVALDADPAPPGVEVEPPDDGVDGADDDGDEDDAPTTTTVPRMNGWIEHMYWNVPALVKVCVALCPFRSTPLSKLPLVAVAVCSDGPRFVQVTLSPTLMVV